jgi:Leucine-rich repeat (LRR) protein
MDDASVFVNGLLCGMGCNGISALSELVNFETLHLFRNQVNDLNPLAPLVNLEIFYLFENGFESLTPHYNLTNLKELWLGGNQNSDLSCVLLLFSDTNV